MKHFVGVKAVKAEPMTLGEYNKHRGWEIPENEDPEAPGYLVEYTDGYQSWSPKEAFERSYFGLDDPTKVTQKTMNRFMYGSEVEVSSQWDRTTLVRVVPRTGFYQLAHSTCVDPSNYDERLGMKICFEEIERKFYPLLGFVLAWANNGVAIPEDKPAAE